MTELFDKHMYEYKPIFYHYLDGYIKEDGYNGAYEFLKTHGSKFIGEENITIGKSGKYSKANGFYIELYNFITKEEALKQYVIFELFRLFKISHPQYKRKLYISTSNYCSYQ